MRFGRVGIASVAAEVPPSVLSSDEIEARLAPLYERIGLVPGRLELMTGIKERRYWPQPIRPSEIAAAAGERALAGAGVSRDEVGVLVHASVCRDFLEPATAAVVHDRLGLPASTQIFDLSNACLGVMNGILVVASMIESGIVGAGLVVSGENGKPLVDATIARLVSDPSVNRKSLKLAFPSLTIGSGGAAVVVADRRRHPAHALLAAAAGTASEHVKLCEGGHDGHSDGGVLEGAALEMSTDAEALLHAGLALARTTFTSLSEALGSARLDRTITHQVGKAHTKGLYDALELEVTKGFFTYPWLGNVGSASLPMTLCQAVSDGAVTQGHRVGLLGIGSGLSSIMLGVEW
ncbi:MAG: 3-oxoacyl-ACP synthase III [Deltaproteobacteria bacterium]|nr:3-oxoacyl-ACP synthase III [Deltaproteobacteria bacterium]